jgi:transcription initiation factor TFIID subunit 2
MAYTLRSQALTLSVDFENQVVTGRTKLQIETDPGVSSISLFAKQLEVLEVTVNELAAEFNYPSLYQQAKYVQQVHTHTLTSKELKDLQQLTWVAWDLENERKGYLQIDIPPELQGGQLFTVSIVFQVTKPVMGLHFLSTRAGPVLVADDSFESRRCWMPCADTFQSQYDFVLELVIPEDFTAAASGDLLGIYAGPGVKKVQFSLSQIWIDTIGLVVARMPVVVQDINRSGVVFLSSSSQARLELTAMNPYFSTASILAFLEVWTSRAYPYKSLHIAFVPDLGPSRAFANLAVLDCDYLLDARVIEGRSRTMRELVKCIAYNWGGCLYRLKAWADYWLFAGLIQYLAWDYTRSKEGPNEIQRLVAEAQDKLADWVSQGLEIRPLSSHFFSHPDELQADFILQVKAPLVFSQIEARVGQSHLQRVVRQHFGAECSTAVFVKQFKRLCGVSLKQFARYWIYGTGMLSLDCSFAYNKANNSLDFTLRQQPLSLNYLKSKANLEFQPKKLYEYTVPLRLNSMRQYTGPLTVIVHETDGYEERDSVHHVLNVEGEMFTTQIPCKKRVRKPTNSKRREDTDKQNECPVLWVRVDPEFELLRRIAVHQPESMSLEQLRGEHDFIGQQEAMLALARSETYSTLLRMLSSLDDAKLGYLTRMAAAKAMALSSKPSNAYKGLDFLLYFLRQRLMDKGMVRPNDFRDSSEYAVIKVVLAQVASVKDMSMSHEFTRLKVNSNFVVEFVAQIYRSNDNSFNAYDDSHWKAHLLQVLASFNNPLYAPEILHELLRVLRFDTVKPSPRYVLTATILKELPRFVQTNKLSNDPDFLQLVETLKSPFSLPRNLRGEGLVFLVTYYLQVVKDHVAALKSLLSWLSLETYSPKMFTPAVCQFLKSLQEDEPQWTQMRETELVQSVLWDFLISPLCLSRLEIRYLVARIYKQLFSYDWNDEVIDPAWEKDLDSWGDTAIDISEGDWKDWASQVLERLMNHKLSGPFLEPVDYVGLGLPDYPEVVADPMDFSTVKLKLEGGEYLEFAEFSADISLVFDNCRLYNMEGSLVFNYADQLDTFFRTLTKPISQKLTASNMRVKIRLTNF